MGSNENNFPQFIQALRLKSKLSQQQLGDRLGKKRVTISAWENGTREPSLGDLVKLSDIFSCPIDGLFGRLSKPGPDWPLWLRELRPELEALDFSGQEAVKALVKGLKK
jgi:transcriptional regulator with XRE-family HTH domain